MGKFSASASANATKDEERIPQLDVPFCGHGFLRNVRKDNEFGSNDNRVLIFEFIALPPNEANYPIDSPKSHWEIEWEPSADDFEAGPEQEQSNVDRMVDRLAYRLKYWLGEEKAKQVSKGDGDSPAEFWDDLRDNIIEAMAPQISPDVQAGDVIAAVNETLSDGDEEGSRKGLNHREAGLYKVENDTVRLVKMKVTGYTYIVSQGENEGMKKGNLQMPKYKGALSNEESDYPVSLSASEQRSNQEWVEFTKVEPSDNGTVEEEGYKF